MPYSYDTFNTEVSEVIADLRPRTLLDVGAGAGKYGDMVRVVATRENFKCNTTAYEINISYMERFDLISKYNNVVIDDVMSLLTMPRCRYDMVIIGDCIEHMRKSDGLDLLNFLIYRTKRILVIYPNRFIQDDWEGHLHEAHISTWSNIDFLAWRASEVSRDNMSLFSIPGYME